MKRESLGPILSTVFVDYDNIYLSLKRKSEEAAKRFAKDAGLWLREIESGRLITATNGSSFAMPRRIVMCRCYGNPVPRRNANDNSTDMNSFPFVRHHFLRAGFEVVVRSRSLTAANAMVKLLRLQQVTGGVVPTDDGTVHRVVNGLSSIDTHVGLLPLGTHTTSGWFTSARSSAEQTVTASKRARIWALCGRSLKTSWCRRITHTCPRRLNTRSRTTIR